MPRKDEIVGLVLAGGQSRRMGEDKAMLCPTGAFSLLDIAFGKLSSLTDACFISCAKGKTYPPHKCIEDHVSGLGPLSGILSAMRLLKSYRAILALACDMPLMPPQMLEWLVHAWKKDGRFASLVAWQSRLSGKIQTLCALYATDSLPFFEIAAKNRNLSLWNIVPENMRLCLPYGPENEKFFHNCNTRADLSFIEWDKLI